jgi:hypothetical protein
MRNDDRGIRRFKISDALLLDLFKTGEHLGYSVIENAIPQDARLLNVRHGWPESSTLELIIESSEFSALNGGDIIPEIVPICVNLTNAK